MDDHDRRKLQAANEQVARTGWALADAIEPLEGEALACELRNVRDRLPDDDGLPQAVADLYFIAYDEDLIDESQQVLRCTTAVEGALNALERLRLRLGLAPNWDDSIRRRDEA